MKNAPKYQWLLTIVLLATCIGIAKQYEVDVLTVHTVAAIQNVADSYVQQSNGAGRYFYGPFSLLVIRPLGLLTFVQAKWVWIALQTLCYFVLFHFLYLFYPLMHKSFAFWLLTFIFLINPVHGNFQSNNIQLMLMAALLYAEALTGGEKTSQFFAGVIVSLLASIKIFPAFIGVYYLLTKKKPVTLGMIAGALVALLSPFLFFGWDTTLHLYEAFVVNVSTYQADNELTRPDILSLASMVATFTENKAFLGKQYLSTALFAGISILFFVVCFLTRKSKEAAPYTWALALLLMAVLTPSARVHFWVFCAPAFCLVLAKAEESKKLSKPYGLMLLVSLAMIALTTQAIIGKDWNDYIEILRIPLIGLFVIAGMLSYEINKQIKARSCENASVLTV